MNINKTYVVNLKHRTDRWEDINKNFKGTGLKLTRWNAVYGKNLTDDQVKKITTDFCYEMCSPGMIGCWLSHYGIWLNIIRNNEDNVLVLEDDAFPAADYKQRINKVLAEIPKDYDLVYFGCIGTCEVSGNNFYKILDGEKGNEVVYQDNKKLENIVKPAFPLATHAYMISQKGAKKLLNNEKIKKVLYHIDFTLSNVVYNDKDSNFKVFAVLPPLINQGFDSNGSDIAESNHPIINYTFSKLKFTEGLSLDYMNNVQAFYIRRLGVPVTQFLIMATVLSLLIGATFSKEWVDNYVKFLIVIYGIEIIITKGKNLKMMIFELIVLIIAVYLSYNIKTKLLSK